MKEVKQKKTVLVETIQKSVEIYGQFYPILIDADTKEILDGRKRDLAIENPRVEEVKIQSPEHKMAIKYHNLWLREQVDGAKKTKILAEIAEETGWRGNKPFADFFGVTEQAISKYLPQKYKNEVKSKAGSAKQRLSEEKEAVTAVISLNKAAKTIDEINIPIEAKEKLKDAIAEVEEEIKQTPFTPTTKTDSFKKWMSKVNPLYLSVWGCLDKRPEGYGDAGFHGNCSPTVIIGVLEKFSHPDQTILDPMAGSGTFGDVAKAMGYSKVFMSDIKPMREDIEKRDASNTGYDDNQFDLVFAHYPYWKLIEYTENNPLDASRMEFGAFMDWSEKVFIEMTRILRKKGCFIVMIGNMRKEGVLDLESHISLQGSRHFTLWDKIIKTIRTWSPETKGSRMGLAQSRAKQHNYSIVNHDTILVFRKD